MFNQKRSLVNKAAIKDWLGEIPLAAEAYWYLRQPGRPIAGNFSLHRLDKCLPQWRPVVETYRRGFPSGKKVLIFATLRYWIEHTALLGMAFAGLGHQVILAYLPYANWRQPLNRFDLRRQDAYVRSILEQCVSLFSILPLIRTKKTDHLPQALLRNIEENALRDTQYTLQVEDIEQEGDLYRLRLERDTEAVCAVLPWLRENRPDVVITPNGSILEFNAIYNTARYLDIPVVTFEFGEQRQRIWLAHNGEVMRQDTGALWEEVKNLSLTPEEWDRVRGLFAARQGASLWENFSRRWQGVPSQGGIKVRHELGLDERPTVLLAANVIGDSLTLGRQVFSDSMTEWLKRTVQYFAQHPEVQLVVRIHPGELITKGPSVEELVKHELPGLPEHVHIVSAGAKVNTYDIVEFADLGLVYTTTVGMEMAMSGVPVIVIGNTHYRGKSFTLDPQNWEAYFTLLSQILQQPECYRLTRQQVEAAWHYAYRFFFDYPQPFPWHLVRMWEDVKEWPIERVLSAEGQAKFGSTFRYLLGEPVKWA